MFSVQFSGNGYRIFSRKASLTVTVLCRIAGTKRFKHAVRTQKSKGIGPDFFADFLNIVCRRNKFGPARRIYTEIARKLYRRA
jgi:hypothetical protein